MRELIAAGALITGLFSGVDMEHITDTPRLVQAVTVEATGADLLQFGEGMVIGEFEGQPVVVTEEGFAMEFSGEMQAGVWSMALDVVAFNRGADSYWVQIDGQQLDRPLRLPLDALKRSSFGFRLEETGTHSVRVVLREAAGSMIRHAELSRPSVQIPQPPMREELVGKHPRLLFTAEDIDAMRARLDDETVQRFYTLPSTLTRKPPAYVAGKRNGGAFRSLGTYAMAYRLTGDPEQLAACIEWLEAATAYPHCGVDLDAEYFMEGVALSYDWLYDDLPEDLRGRVRDTIVRQCREVYSASLAGRTGGGLSFQQNHFWFAHLAMIMGAAAVYGEVPEAEQWLAWGWDRVERVFLTFGTDGGFHEGPSYWDYSMPTLYLLVDLYEWCTGEKIPWADQGLHGQSEFRLRHIYPGLTLTAALEDTSITKGGPATKLYLWEARRFRDPMVMGIADAMVKGPSSDRFNLLWLDETLEPQDPFAEMALARHYEDVEIAFARTSWEDDATALALVSRPLGGHLLAELCERFEIGGTGHNHPAQGHFVLFGRGEVLAGDPGYTYKKLTSNHNTILVDGEGQYGSGEMWPRPTPGRARITGFATEGDITIIAADPSSAYPTEMALTRFERIVALAGPDLAVVYDRLQSAEPHVFSWLLHHYGEASEADGIWTVTHGQAQLTIAPLQPADVAGTMQTCQPTYVHPTRDLTPKEDPEIGLVELQSELVNEATFLVPLLIGEAGEIPSEVELLEGDGFTGVRVADTVVVFSTGAGTMAIPAPWGETITTEAGAVVATERNGVRRVVSL